MVYKDNLNILNSLWAASFGHGVVDAHLHPINHCICHVFLGLGKCKDCQSSDEQMISTNSTRILGAREIDKSKATRATGEAIVDNLNRLNFPIAPKQMLQVSFTGVL